MTATFTAAAALVSVAASLEERLQFRTINTTTTTTQSRGGQLVLLLHGAAGFEGGLLRYLTDGAWHQLSFLRLRQ